MPNPIRIAIDAMGGDHGVKATLPGAIAAIKAHPDLHLILVGKAALLTSLLGRRKLLNHPQISIQNATEEVGMDESPSLALRNKKDSSMRVAINLIKEGKADACVSAGNTGALMATSRFVLKTISGIDRPAIIYAMPNVNHDTGERCTAYMLDLGANVDCTEAHLFQFAVMGSVLCQAIQKISEPRVALLNIGEEEMKGLDSIKKAAKLLDETAVVNYIGFIEGNDLFSAKADVIVCDGFIGNVALKTSEGMIKFLGYIIKSSIESSWFTRLCAFFALPIFMRVKSRMNVKSYNGASLIGLKGIVIKSHGSADAEAFKSAISVARHEVEQDIPKKVHTQIETILSRAQTQQMLSES